jgi:glycosyltransferase involved in cell wall biosynthesis
VRTVALASGDHAGLDVPILGVKRLAPPTLRALRAEIRRARVVIAHGSTTLPACAVASAATGTPFAYRQISDSLFWARTRARRIRVRAGLSRAARVVALWSGAADTLHARFGVELERLVVIPNGIPPARFPPVTDREAAPARVALGLEPNRPTVAYVGALVPEKGVDTAVEAIASLPDAQLLVVGAGPDRARLEAIAEQRTPGNVVFAGAISDPMLAFAAANVVVLPSTGGDSMPAVLMEAAFAGVPAVSTPVEGIPEIVIDGVTGVLVSQSSPGELANALARILGAPDLARRLAAAARAHCEARFTIDQVAARWDKLVDALIQSRNHA